jgi:hypothetical protein
MFVLDVSNVWGHSITYRIDHPDHSFKACPGRTAIKEYRIGIVDGQMKDWRIIRDDRNRLKAAPESYPTSTSIFIRNAWLVSECCSGDGMVEWIETKFYRLFSSWLNPDSNQSPLN